MKVWWNKMRLSFEEEFNLDQWTVRVTFAFLTHCEDVLQASRLIFRPTEQIKETGRSRDPSPSVSTVNTTSECIFTVCLPSLTFVFIARRLFLSFVVWSSTKFLLVILDLSFTLPVSTQTRLLCKTTISSASYDSLFAVSTKRQRRVLSSLPLIHSWRAAIFRSLLKIFFE